MKIEIVTVQQIVDRSQFGAGWLFEAGMDTREWKASPLQ
jgi:hypothetical protein